MAPQRDMLRAPVVSVAAWGVGRGPRQVLEANQRALQIISGSLRLPARLD